MPSLNTATLAESLGDYCREFFPDLFQKELLGSDINEHVTQMTGISDELVLTSLFSEEMVKPYKKEFQPTPDALGFKPRILKVRPCKLDLQIEAKSLHKTWMAMFKTPGASAYNLPFEGYLMREIIARVKADLEKNAYFQGNHNANGTTPKDTFDGALTILDEEIGENGINMATLTQSNAVSEIEKVAIEISETLSNTPLKMFMSHTAKKFYSMDYRNRYGSLPYNTEFKKTFLDVAPNVELVGVDGINGVNALTKLFITPKPNICIGSDRFDDMDSMEIEKEKRNINFLMDFSTSLQFVDLGLVTYGRPTP